jgi:hypothetical protein
LPFQSQHDDTANSSYSFTAELNSLSLNERETMINDLHGMSKDIDESPSELVARSLTEMDAVLKEHQRTFKNAGCEGYNLADAQSNGAYVENKAFRLMFLRAESFDSQLAAKRMLRFFEQKLELFGPGKLCKDITLRNLSVADMQCLIHGHLQILPTRDRAGRAAIVHIPVFIKSTAITHDVMVSI